MRGILKEILKFSLILLSVSLLSCTSADSPSNKIDLNFVPETPYVLNAPQTVIVNGTEVELAPPWFQFTFNVGNSETETSKIKTVTIISIELSVLGDESFKVAFTGGAIAEGRKFVAQHLEATELADKTATTPAGVTFYIPGLPKNSTGNYFYTMQLKAVGWFGDEDNPGERFERTYVFSTQ